MALKIRNPHQREARDRISNGKRWLLRRSIRGQEFRPCRVGLPGARRLCTAPFTCRARRSIFRDAHRRRQDVMADVIATLDERPITALTSLVGGMRGHATAA